jgi:hypothetical protein
MEEIQEEKIISDNENNIPLTKKKRTINAPRSEKQIEAFKKAQEKRDENRRIIKEQKEIKLAKIFMENKLKEQEQQAEEKEIKPLKKEHRQKKQVVKYVESESESEEEVIYVKKPKKKITKQKVIYVSSDDDDDDEPPTITKKPEMKRQTNRVIRNKKEVNNDIIDYTTFFN